MDNEPLWLKRLDTHPRTAGAVYFNASISSMDGMMYAKVYDWSALNCSRTIKDSITVNDYWQRTYGRYCFEDISQTWDGKVLQPTDMMRGLPIQYQHPKDKVTLTHIHVLTRATVNKNGDVFVNNLKIVGNRCPARYTAEKYSSSFPSPHTQQKAKMYDEVFTVSQYWGDGYFHLLVETLPRLTPFLQFLSDNPSIKVHVFGVDRAYVLPLFSQFGLTRDRFVYGLIRARVLYLPQTGMCGGALVFNSRLQSMIQRSFISTHESNPRKSIVIIKRSHKRYFKYHNQILHALIGTARSFNSNYRVEVFDDNPLPTLNQTMQMFNRAFMVVAPHGAGESNLLYSEPGTILIEGLCRHPNLCYKNHMQGLGHQYYGVYVRQSDCFRLLADDIVEPVKKYLRIIQIKTN